MTVTDTGDDDLQARQLPQHTRMAPQDQMTKKHQLTKGRTYHQGKKVKKTYNRITGNTREETVKLILKLNSRPFPREIIRMMSTFLDKAVEEESVATYMSVMHEAEGDQAITLAFEGSLTRGKGSKNNFPDQMRTWAYSTPVTIKTTRTETDKGERIYEIKDTPRIEITLADETETSMINTCDTRDLETPEIVPERAVEQREIISVVSHNPAEEQVVIQLETVTPSMEEKTTVEPTPEEERTSKKVVIPERKETITMTREYIPRSQVIPKEGWKSLSATIFVLDLFPWCVLGTEGIACTMGRLVHSLVIQARRKVVGWLYRQLARPVKGTNPRSRDIYRQRHREKGHIHGFTLEGLPHTSADANYITMGFVPKPLDLFDRDTWSGEGEFGTRSVGDARSPSGIPAMEMVRVPDTGTGDSVFFQGPS